MKTDIADVYQLPTTGYLRQSDLLEILPFSAATLWRMVKAQKFPSPVKLSARITAWRAEDVRAWMTSLMPQAA